MNENKINVKDLLNVGIYTALYFVGYFVVALLSVVPVLYPLIYVLGPIVTAIPFFLFLTKVNKFGLVPLMSLILGIIAFLMGYTWIPVVGFPLFGIVADLIFRSGHYKGFKRNIVGYWIFSLGIITYQMPLWFLADTYIADMKANYGEELVNKIVEYLPPWMGFVAVGLVLIGAVVGSFLAKKMLKKHFERAGVA